MAMMNEMEYRTIGSALAGGYRAAVYCRLSKDDDLQGESASIANQRDMLEKYCEKQGWEVVAVYQDDGFTGLNMERPDLQRMLRAIERRQINLVITKDLSRLGRNYLQTGHLIEDFFPRNGVRYIAMNDGIDTLRDNNDIAPFKNILNEMYSKDISKKVHSSYLLKAQKGQFTGCLAPFGYRKDPEDKNHLLIDEETAPIVRLIFGYALNGHGPNYIRRRLEEEKIPCPTWWNRERGLRNTRTKWEKKDPENGRYMWDFSVIKDLLMNPVYTGAIASQKKDYRFKIGTIGEKKPEDWIVVEGQHEPLIDRMSFAELKTLIENLTVEARFATDGASNLIQVRGNLPTDQKKLVKYLERLIKELDGIIKKLYEDNFTGKLSDERYMIFSKDYEDEQHTLKAEVEDLRSQIEEQTSKVVNINSFLTVAKKYTSFETLTPGMLHELIEKIVVHEGDKSSGHRIQKIDIYYSFVGDLETSHVVAQRNLKTRKAA